VINAERYKIVLAREHVLNLAYGICPSKNFPVDKTPESTLKGDAATRLRNEREGRRGEKEGNMEGRGN